MPLRCAASRNQSASATVSSRSPNAPKATAPVCASWWAAGRLWYRPTIWPREASQALAERAVAMARAAPEDRFAGLAEPDMLARVVPDLNLLDAAMPTVDALEALARAAEAAALAVPGVSKSSGASASAGIGGMVLVTSGGFHGAYLGSSHGVSMQAIAGEGTAMETDYDYSSARHLADLEAAEDDRPLRRAACGAPPQSPQGDDAPGSGDL